MTVLVSGTVMVIVEFVELEDAVIAPVEKLPVEFE